MENEFKGGLNTNVDASSIPHQNYSTKEAGSICIEMPNTGQNIVISEEHKLSWLSIGDLKALLDCAKKCQDDLTAQDGTDIHDYWHNVIEKTVIEIKNKIFEIFPPEL